jgi:RNA polymerase sigma-70 factor (ECF subfamily)
MGAALQYAALSMQPETVEIARGLRRRDPELLDALIAQYQHRLFRFLLYFTRNRTLAEDVFQETWLRVLERGRQYDARWKFETWLLSIARNLVLDNARRKQAVSLDEARPGEEGGELSPLDRLASAEPGPFEQAAGQQLGEQLEAALAHIPAYYREVLTLRFHEDMQLEEIAQVTGAPLSTVKSRLRRGLELMQQRMERTGHGDA